MSLVPRFAAYAAAFEDFYARRDASLVAPFFARDAVYEVGLPEPLGGRFEGRDAVLAYFERVLDDFDRRFASREVQLLEGPTQEGSRVRVRGRALYRTEGLPPLAFDLEEIATFDGDLIAHLEDRYEPDQLEAVRGYLAEHGAKLGMPPLRA